MELPWVPLLLDSTTSISPFWGQLDGSVSHSAGQVAQPYGEWTTSKMNSPWSYCLLEVTRTDRRPVVWFAVVVSTLMIAVVSEAYVRFDCLAASAST